MKRPFLISALALTIAAGTVSCDARADNGVATLTDKEVKSATVSKRMADHAAVVVHGSHIVGDLCLADAGIGAKVTPHARAGVRSELVFVGCVFEGKVSASKRTAEGRQLISPVFESDITFIDCTFLGEVDMSYAICRGLLTMEHCTFRSAARFEACSFLLGAVMNRSAMEGECSFDASHFGPQSSLMGMRYATTANFQNTRFESCAPLADSHFGGYAGFSGVKAREGFDAGHCKFAGRVEARDITIVGDVRLAGAQFADKVIAENVTVIGNVDSQGSAFEKEPSVTQCYTLAQPNPALPIKKLEISK